MRDMGIYRHYREPHQRRLNPRSRQNLPTHCPQYLYFFELKIRLAFSMDLRACGNPSILQFGTRQCMPTYCSTANLFIPSRRTPVTFSFKYLRAGAPCAAAFAGNGGGTSTLPLVFLIGVAVLCAVGVATSGGGAGDG